MRHLIVTLCAAILFSTGIANATTVFDCTAGFSSTASNPCGVAIQTSGTGAPFLVESGNGPQVPFVSGSTVNLMPTGSTHAVQAMNYQTQVNVQAFDTTFTFIPNGQNVSLVFNNSNNNTFNGNFFNDGAGCEASFFQGFSQTNPPNNVWAMEFDQINGLNGGDAPGAFTYSNVQVYQSNQAGYNNLFIECPCDGGSGICGTNNSDTGNYPKLSTSPVALNSPATTALTTTGDTYSAHVVYDGTTLTLSLQDVTLMGSVFTHAFTTDGPGLSLNIPASVGSNTAWVGLHGATGGSSTAPLILTSWIYSTGSPTPTPTATATPSPTPTPCVPRRGVTCPPTPTPTSTSTPRG